MKLTRELLKNTIDSASPYMTAEDIFVYMVMQVLRKCPQVLPYFCKGVGQTLSDIFIDDECTLRLSNERATYIEAYLSGKMYPEEIAKQQEYIDIQRGHATKIREETSKRLGYTNKKEGY